MAVIPGVAGLGAGYPQWLYNTTTHTVSVVTSPATKFAAESVSWPAKLVFFTSQSAADTYMSSQGGGGDISKSPLTTAANTGTDVAATVGSWGTELAKFLASLQNRQMWLRIAEVIIGLGLIIVAVDELAKGTPIGDAAHAAGKAALIVR
jgi:hypothetical protein